MHGAALHPNVGRLSRADYTFRRTNKARSKAIGRSRPLPGKEPMSAYKFGTAYRPLMPQMPQAT